MLVLLVVGVSEARKNEVVVNLVNSERCCRDDGFSEVLYRMAEAAFSYGVAQFFERRKKFLRSPMVMLILRTWADSLPLCVFDLECVNSTIDKMSVSGRMPSFAAVAQRSECAFC